MDVHDQPAVEDKQPPARAPFQFGLKHVLAAPLWLALLFAAHALCGIIGVVLFLLLSWLAIGIWLRSAAWICGVACGLLILGLLLFPSAVHVSDPRMACRNYLKQIGLALHNYHSHYGCFPPAYIADEKGRPMHSWRVLILPYLEQKPLYDQYDFSEPWDGPNNGKLADIPLAAFNCPGDGEGPSTTTSYVAVVGPNTAWPGSESITFADFSDGMSITILVVEVHNSGVHWMEPKDLDINQIARGVNPAVGRGISSRHRVSGANVLFADGSVRHLSDDVAPTVLQTLLTIDGGETLPTEF